MSKIFRLNHGFTLVLASASPRRRQLLGTLGIPFTIQNSGIDEPLPQSGESPAEYCMRAATAKGIGCLNAMGGAKKETAIIIAADTIVCLDNSILGKPRDAANALEMLNRLSGKAHTVYTSVFLDWPEDGKRLTEKFHEKSEVIFGNWPEDVLRAYACGGEPADKAGAYAVQGEGAFLARSIHGSWTNVVGLPLALLCEKLLEHNLIRAYGSHI